MYDPLAILSSVLVGVAVGMAVHFLKPVYDAMTARYTADLTPRLQQAYVDTSDVPAYMRLWGVALLAVPAVLWLVAGIPILAILAALLIYRLPRMVMRARIRRQRTLIRNQLVSACVNLANTARAGMALPQGLQAIIPETPEPLVSEFRRITGEFEAGRPFPDALRAGQERLRMETFTLFVAAVLVCLERGGKVTDALDRISRSLQENQRLERKREADTASGRRVVLILAMTPIAFLALFTGIDPDGMSPVYTTTAGQMILGIVAVLDYLSVMWAQAILKLDTAAR